MKGKQPLPGIQAEMPDRAIDEFAISTPFGIVTIGQNGRKISFDLYSDVRQSRHNVALFTYVQKLRKAGVTRFNTDHIPIAGKDKRLSLVRGDAKLDIVYYKKNKLYECELKTNREVGLDVTARQLTELCRHVENLTLLVPKGSLAEASYIVGLINLTHQITIEAYDDYGEDEG